jgi:hypothetical protein
LFNSSEDGASARSVIVVGGAITAVLGQLFAAADGGELDL